MARSLLNKADERIYELFYTEGPMVAYPAFCQYFFEYDPLPKQTLMSAAGYDPRLNEYLIKNITVLGAIRSGKTQGKGLDFLCKMLMHPDSQWVNTGPSVDQAATMYRLLLDFISRPRFRKFVMKPDGSNGIVKFPYPTIYLFNGSSLEFRSIGYEGELLRSREWDGANADEAALFRWNAIQVLKGRLLGAKPGRKPNAQRFGLFSMTTSPLAGIQWLIDWYNKGNLDNPNRDLKYYSIKMLTRENIHLDKDAIDELSASYTDRMRRQELEAELLDPIGQVFPTEHILESFSQTYDSTGAVRELEEAIARQNKDTAFDHELDAFQLPREEGHYYLSAADLGKGTKFRRADPSGMGQRGATVLGTLDVTKKPWKLVAFKYIERTGQWGWAIEEIREMKKFYGSQVIVDTTGPGDPIDEWAEREGVIFDESFKIGGVSKPQMIHNLQLVLERGWMKGPYIRKIFEQLKNYVVGDESIAQDIVMMLALLAHHAKEREDELEIKTHNQRIVGTQRLGLTVPRSQRGLRRRGW